MADEKFSDMPSATSCAQADLVCISQGGVSKKVSHTNFLTGDGSALLALNQSSTAFAIDAAGQAYVQVVAGQNYSIVMGLIQVMLCTASGDVALDAKLGNTLYLGNSGDSIVMGNAGVSSVTIQGLYVDVTNHVATPSNWMGAQPVLVRTAIDRIAAAVVGLLGTQIP